MKTAIWILLIVVALVLGGLHLVTIDHSNGAYGLSVGNQTTYCTLDVGSNGRASCQAGQ